MIKMAQNQEGTLYTSTFLYTYNNLYSGLVNSKMNHSC